MDNQYDKLRNWLDKLVDAEFRDLIRALLTPEEQNHLPQPLELVNRGNFLGFMQRKEQLDEVETWLLKKYPNRFTQKPPSLPQRVPFTNQEYEINLLLAPFAPAYYLLDAPAGYGKTELLKELERRFKKENWNCAYVSINENDTFAGVITILAKKLNITPSLIKNSGLPWEVSLGSALCSQWIQLAKKEDTKKGLVLLIDLEKRPSLPLVMQLRERLIPAIEESLRTLEFFANKHNRLRVIIAGRYLAAHLPIRITSSLKVLSLSAFDYEVIRDSTGKYLAKGNPKSVHQFSAHLFYLTGGHPGCMTRVLEMYTEKTMAPNLFLQYFRQTIWQNIVRNFVDDVRSGISERITESILNRLSVFRYLDYSILKSMLEDEGIDEKSEFELADELTATYLFDWKGRFLRDDITRRLLANRLQHEMPEIFSERCQQAQRMCVERLQLPNVQKPEMWIIEYLFQSLQEHANAILELDKRTIIRDKFLKEHVPKALQIFIDACKRPPEQWPAEQNALKQAMKDDWEFRFTVNYYLRHDQYNDKPYNELQENVEQYFYERSLEKKYLPKSNHNRLGKLRLARG